jgi:uncharacterized membrane protein YfcA
MPDLQIALLMIVGGLAAGVFGSLLGLGGGILIVPLLTLGFGLPLREAVGVSLVAVIVTSSASAGVYLERHVADLRLGMTLELFTASGALVGGLIAFLLSERILAGLFTLLLMYTALSMARRRDSVPVAATLDAGLTLDARSTLDAAPSVSRNPSPGQPSAPGYVVHRLGWGIVGSLFAGLVSALLGIGGGLVKVPVMHLVMGVPLRVATATSNLMIGITAAASAIIYLLRGGIDVYVAGPTAVGVFVGASIGSRTVDRIDVRLLRILFVGVLLVTAWQMAGRALR